MEAKECLKEKLLIFRVSLSYKKFTIYKIFHSYYLLLEKALAKYFFLRIK